MLRTIPIRWRVLFVLFVVSFVNYFLRNALSVAYPSIQGEFGYTNQEMGWILNAFNISYTLMMIPGGIFGERYGPRRALGGIAVAWGILTWFTGFAPADNPEVTVTVFVERGGGTDDASPIAARIFRRYFHLPDISPEAPKRPPAPEPAPRPPR